MLLVVANSYLDQKKNPEKVHAYTAKVVEIMGAKQGDASASMMSGFANYLNGKQYMDENQFAPADGALRKALPALDSNGAVKAEILFLLGLANYKLAGGNAAKAQDSANYFKACAAIKSPYQATAAANLKRITTEYHGIK
jgi:hypothetical protein